jgi:hypothetical protein
LKVRIRSVSVGAFHWNDRRTGQRLKAATSKAPTLFNDRGVVRPYDASVQPARIGGPEHGNAPVAATTDTRLLRDSEAQRGATATERAELLERLVGLHGILPAYGEALANTLRQARELRAKNRKLLERVRELQTQPALWAKGTRR